MFSKVTSLGIWGATAELVEVEVDLSSGLPRFDLVGLPDSAVSESRERVRSAIKNCNLTFPISRITVNLAPAEFKKEGPLYDLPILVAILIASKQLNSVFFNGCAIVGEIALDGTVRGVKGVLPMTIKARELNIKRLFVPSSNAVEAALVPDIEIYPVSHVKDLLLAANGLNSILPQSYYKATKINNNNSLNNCPDFADVIGQQAAKRALEVAAAGGHHVLMMGSPGAGKSMMAKCLPTILPDLTFDETTAATSIYSIAGLLTDEHPIVAERPFRAPHHTATAVAFAGGGRRAQPGEISLAHNGVLFLDELPLFKKSVIETLRQPLEDGKITITRNAYTSTFPARFTLVCAMNPCPCGYSMDPNKKCTCTEKERHNYISRISGPLLDRIDIIVQVDPISCEDLIKNSKSKNLQDRNQVAESSSQIKERVNCARELQYERFKGTDISCNAQMPSKLIRKYCQLTIAAQKIMLSAYKNLNFSARVNDKILRTSRTIADLNQHALIDTTDITEAIQYRSIERLY